jgi:hypothetical protein
LGKSACFVISSFLKIQLNIKIVEYDRCIHYYHRIGSVAKFAFAGFEVDKQVGFLKSLLSTWAEKMLCLFEKLLEGRTLSLELILAAHDREQSLLQVLPGDGRADGAQRFGRGVLRRRRLALCLR